MKERKKTARRTLSVLGAIALVLMLVPTLWAADHTDTPSLLSDGGADMADLFVFESPENKDNVVLALTLNCLTQPGADKGLDDSVLYELHIDTDGDLTADHTYKIRSKGNQVRVVGYQTDLQGEYGKTLQDADKKYKFYTGSRDDPFFFDQDGLNGTLKESALANSAVSKFTGVDTLKGTNCTAIVLEIPKLWLAKDDSTVSTIKVWATTKR